MSDWYNGTVVGLGHSNAMTLQSPYFQPPAGINFFIEDGKVVWERCRDGQQLQKILAKCPPYAALLYMLSDAFAKAELQVLNRNTQNDVRGVNKEWQKLFDRPNFLQTKTPFFKQLYLYLNLQGWVYALKKYPAGFSDRPSSIWLLPPWCVEIEPVKGRIDGFTQERPPHKVYLCYDGKRELLDPKDLILFTDNACPLDAETLLPISRAVSLEYPITNIAANLEALASLTQNRGAIGILSNSAKDTNGTIPLTPPEKKQIQDDFKRQFGLTRGKDQFIITEASLSWQPMAFDMAQLGLFEGYLAMTKDIFAAYGVPFPLSTHSDQSTYNNILTADRQLYQNVIMPAAKAITEQMEIGIDGIGNNISLVFNFDSVEALQATAKEKAETLGAQLTAATKLFDYNIWSKNKILEYIGENKESIPEFDLLKFETPEVVQENERNAKQASNGNSNA